MKKISLTGHRPKDLFGYNIYDKSYNSIRERLTILLRNELKLNDVEGHSGLALGADTIWAEEILKLKDSYKDKVTLWAEIPHPKQSEAWPNKNSREVWSKLVSSSSGQTIYEEEYSPWCMQKRNEGMLNVADELIAVWNGTLKPKSGTSNAIKYWLKTNHKDFYVLRPNDNYIRKDLVNKDILSIKNIPEINSEHDLQIQFNKIIENKSKIYKIKMLNNKAFAQKDTDNKVTVYELIKELESSKYNIFTIKKYIVENNIFINKENKTFKIRG